VAWVGESTHIKLIQNLEDQNMQENQENSKDWTNKASRNSTVHRASLCS